MRVAKEQRAGNRFSRNVGLQPGYATPLLMIFFWGCYLVRHDWMGSRFHIIVLVLSIITSVSLHLLARHTLLNRKLSLLKAGIFSLILVTPVLLLTSSLTFKAIQGDPCGEWQSVGSGRPDFLDGTYTISGLPFGDFACVKSLLPDPFQRRFLQ